MRILTIKVELDKEKIAKEIKETLAKNKEDKRNGDLRK